MITINSVFNKSRAVQNFLYLEVAATLCGSIGVLWTLLHALRSGLWRMLVCLSIGKYSTGAGGGLSVRNLSWHRMFRSLFSDVRARPMRWAALRPWPAMMSFRRGLGLGLIVGGWGIFSVISAGTPKSVWIAALAGVMAGSGLGILFHQFIHDPGSSGLQVRYLTEWRWRKRLALLGFTAVLCYSDLVFRYGSCFAQFSHGDVLLDGSIKYRLLPETFVKRI